MNVTLALTAIYHGAIATNHTRVVELIKNDAGQVRGAVVEDALTGRQWPVRAKAVINATGPFCDAIRQMDDPTIKPMVSPSAGTHIVLPNYFSPRNMGLIDPSTSDGRVLFFLPWEGNVISGTTDAPTELSFAPRASDGDIEFILGEVDRYLTPDVTVRRSDVLAAWAGIRPLVRDPDAKPGRTEAIVRSHVVTQSPSGLITVAGGKWTTYRSMAQEAIDFAIKMANLTPTRPDVDTSRTLLVGAHGYAATTYLKLIQRYGLETDVALHLARSYGDRAVLVADLCEDTRMRWPLHGRRLSPLYPYDEAEVLYACRAEYAETAVDVLARRTRLAFLSCQAARDVLPRVIELMAKERQWSREECDRQRRTAESFLATMGLHELYPHRAQFDKDEITRLREAFRLLDPHSEGSVPVTRALSSLRAMLPTVTSSVWSDITRRVDPDGSGRLGFTDFLEAVAIAQAKDVSNGPSCDGA